MVIRCRLTFSLALLLVTMAAGCGGSPKLLPVSGVVTLDGQPLSDAGVLFCPIANGPAASDTTDARGRFQLVTVNMPGAIVGSYRVSVAKTQTTGADALGTPGSKVHTRWLIPEKYGKPETSGLQAAVGRDSTEFRFALSSRH
jgi:hypothetical protein